MKSWRFDPYFSSGVSLADIRLRFLQLKLINRQLSQLLLMVDLCTSHPLSLGQLLSDVAAPLLFYDVKISFLHAVLNTSTRRSLEQAPPEIKMDPLESVAGALYVVADLWSLCHSRLPSPPLPSPPPPPQVCPAVLWRATSARPRSRC